MIYRIDYDLLPLNLNNNNNNKKRKMLRDFIIIAVNGQFGKSFKVNSTSLKMLKGVVMIMGS